MSSLPFSLPQMLGQNGPPASGGPVPGGANPYPGAAPVPGAPAFDQNTQQQLMLIKTLADQGVPFDKIPALIQSMTGGSNGHAAAQPPAAAPAPYAQGQQPWGQPVPVPGDVRDRGYQDNLKSPPRYRGGRSRSRSPDRGWGSRGSPRGGRDGPDFGRGTPPRDRDHRRGGNDYRQRSPQGRHGQSHSPSHDLPQVDKWIEFDRSLPSGHIKVFSRTLFVGGVTCSEAELRSIFTRFGTVQTCIVNKDKRHAFVKMISRRDAVSAKEGTEDTRNLEVPLRVSEITTPCI
jgi:protein NRD1